MFDLNFAKDSFNQILAATPLTLIVALVATIIGLGLAILVVIAREKRILVLSQFLAILVSFIRGTPILVQLYVVYYGLPQLLVLMNEWGWNTNPNGLPAIIIAFSAYGLNAMANLSESIRAAYHSVDFGQYEAALSIGMTPFRAMTQIVIPQLIINLIPNFTNIFLDLIKDTALIYNIGLVEIMGQANIVSSIGFKYLETYTDALIIYIIICWIFAQLFRLVEGKLRQRYFVV
ncbi:amino acid ABC transporter permease [Limosilactobacillus vaginalis]|uniref:amino acid ABC transporter permease n=1 Tax=Limosilactobacillus vaginalis TaxID=1633 RepID=UPI0025A362EC|nr:amino acid ABC transporter permease [Limosilactobacillus vaginalis]MDM8264019.1 amino acid ABC transporter permease [Limosilactobacillus vaginalis]